MPLPHLNYSLHPPSITSQQSLPQDHRTIAFLRRRWVGSYTGCKYIALSFNVLFILRILDSLHDSGTDAVNAVHHKKLAVALMTQAIFQLLVYLIMLLCLVMDMIVITTRKLSVADWFWKPSLFFFVLTCGDQTIRLMNSYMNSQHFFELCQKDLGPFTPLALMITMCDLQVQMNNMTGFAALCRDVIATGVYVFSVHYYVTHLVAESKRQQQDAISMHTVPPYQSSDFSHPPQLGMDPVVIHPSTAHTDGMMRERNCP